MAQAKHRREDAAQHLTAAVQRARPDDSVANVRQALVGRELDDTEIVCVLDDNDKLLGVLSFADLFRLADDTLMREAMRTGPAVQASEDQEKVASIALHFGLNSVPVVDSGRRLATSIGLVLPWLLTKLKRDPAFGSGPLATVIQDVLTLLSYFAIVSFLYVH